MKEKGFEQYTLKELINKIKKLRQKYKAIKDQKRGSGAGCKKPWQFFESLDKILCTRANVSPPLILDTMQQDPGKYLQTLYTSNSFKSNNNSGNFYFALVDAMIERYGEGTTYI